MARGFLLNTSTVSFLDLLGNGKIYEVPPYQRDYSWEKDQWEDLWNDIREMAERRDDRHYMGSLVVEGVSDRRFRIIDGQQRLATLSIIALAVLRQLKDLVDKGVEPDANEMRTAELRKRFIGEKDPASLLESSKLFLNENDNGFYQDYLVQLRSPSNIRGLSRSNKLLWDCFEYYRIQIASESAIAQSGQDLAALLSETIARQLLFILITVDDELNAYTVFETLNARGLELSSTDLIKNYLFSKVSTSSDIVSLQRRWRALVGTVRQEHFPEFLRYHLLCERPRIRTQRLFKLVRERVTTPADVFDLIDALERRAEIFGALYDPAHEYWIEDKECRERIAELKLFRVRQMTPLLFAAWETLSRTDFARVLKLTNVIVFRHIVICGLNPNELESASHDASKALLSGEAKTPADVFEKLSRIYVDDERFEQAFSLLEVPTQGVKKRLAKYLLCRLESDASGRFCDPETDPATLEHVLPENAARGWEDSIPGDKWERFVYRLGNLTLLGASANRALGNASYPEKVTEYAKSPYHVTQAFSADAPAEWTVQLIADRQRRMAKRAAHIWRSDFV